jgi:hypothetical protein
MQPEKASCANCGAALLPGGRFCRKCGQPTDTFGRPSVTEVTTRRLGAQGQPFVGEQNPLAQRGVDSQAARGETRAVLTAETRGLPASPLKRWLPALLLLSVVLLVPLVYLLWPRAVVKIIVPPAPQAPAVPQPQRPVIPPPPSTGINGTGAIDPALIYPNARTTRIISKSGEGDVVQLQTDDSIDEVADWYKKKLNPTEIIQQPERVIYKSDKLTAFISSNGTGTNIMLRQGGD